MLNNNNYFKVVDDKSDKRFVIVTMKLKGIEYKSTSCFGLKKVPRNLRIIKAQYKDEYVKLDCLRINNYQNSKLIYLFYLDTF